MSYDLTKTARLGDIKLLSDIVKKIDTSVTGGASDSGYSVTLATTSWLAPTGGEPDLASSYAYRCFIPATSLNTTLSASDRVDVIFDDSTLNAISKNGDDLCPLTVTTADGIYLFSNTIPTVDYTATFWVQKGSE